MLEAVLLEDGEPALLAEEGVADVELAEEGPVAVPLGATVLLLDRVAE